MFSEGVYTLVKVNNLRTYKGAPALNFRIKDQGGKFMNAVIYGEAAKDLAAMGLNSVIKLSGKVIKRSYQKTAFYELVVDHFEAVGDDYVVELGTLLSKAQELNEVVDKLNNTLRELGQSAISVDLKALTGMFQDRLGSVVLSSSFARYQDVVS